MADRVMEELDENECLRVIGQGGIGRIAYVGRFRPAVLPVNYKLQGGAIVFRTTENGPLDEDLRTGSPTPTTGWRSRSMTSTWRPNAVGACSSRGRPTALRKPSWTRPAAQASSPGPRATGNCSSGSSRPASPAAAAMSADRRAIRLTGRPSAPSRSSGTPARSGPGGTRRGREQLGCCRHALTAAAVGSHLEHRLAPSPVFSLPLGGRLGGRHDARTSHPGGPFGPNRRSPAAAC
jgi:hypothetical protein